MGREGIALTKIFGIKIIIDYSWFIIFFLVTWSLSLGYFPVVYNQINPAINIILGAVTSVLFFASALIHELSHSLVAQRSGVQIKKITLFLFGGAAHLTEEPKTAWAEFKMAIAGPFSSLILAIFFFGIYYILSLINITIIVLSVFETLAFLNFTLAVFNMLPGFPLDGGRVIRSIIWAITHSLKKATYYASLGGRAIASLMILLGFLEIVIARAFAGIWLVMIGFFLYQAAAIGYKQMVTRDVLSGIEVKDLMTYEEIFVPQELELIKLSDLFLYYKKRSLPVENKNGQVVGVVTIDQIRDISEEDLYSLKVNDIMLDLKGENFVISPNDSILKAFDIMSEIETLKLPVTRENKLLGTISANDINKYIKLKSDLIIRDKKA